MNLNNGTTAIEQMTDSELLEEQRVLEATIEAARDRLGSVENELFYRNNPECRINLTQKP